MPTLGEGRAGAEDEGVAEKADCYVVFCWRGETGSHRGVEVERRAFCRD